LRCQHCQRNQGLFHASFSKVKHRAPVTHGLSMQARSRPHRIPGPTSFWEVVAIPPERLFLRKVFSPAILLSLQSDNKD
jgi:hypothetical protein